MSIFGWPHHVHVSTTKLESGYKYDHIELERCTMCAHESSTALVGLTVRKLPHWIAITRDTLTGIEPYLSKKRVKKIKGKGNSRHSSKCSRMNSYLCCQ